MGALACEMKQDIARRKQGHRTFPGGALQNPFAFLRRGFLRKEIISKGSVISQNEAIDLFHATKAATCCTLVLLGGQRAAWLPEVMHPIVAAGREDPYATPFSKRRRGFSDFLAAIEAGI